MRILTFAVCAALGLPVLGAAVFTSTPVYAQPKAKAPAKKKPSDAKKATRYSAEVTVLHANNSGKGIDKRIGDKPELKKPPFSAYDTYEWIKQDTLPLKKGQPKTVELPNKRVLKTRLLDVLPNDVLKISTSISRPRGEKYLPLLEVKAKAGRSFIVAGPPYKGGILVLVIRLVAEKA